MNYTSEKRELRELLDMVPASCWFRGRSTPVGAETVSLITPDSRACVPGAMFVAVPGTRVDGNMFIPAALMAGASCVVSEREHPEVTGVPVIVVPSARQFLSLASQVFFDYPARHLQMIGITGTSGKTSTAYLVKRVLEGMGVATVMIGTTGYVMPDGETYPPDALPATTPEAFQLNWYLKTGLERGAVVAIVEVSSFALAYDRVYGMHFDCAVFTNFSEDHLGYHGTLEAYLQAKLTLFRSLEQDTCAVLNADDPTVAVFRSAADGARVSTYGMRQPSNVHGSEAVSRTGRTELSVSIDGGPPVPLILSIGPVFQAYNALAAIAVAHALRPAADLGPGLRALGKPLYIPGRYERIECGQPFEVIVDYAHTPEEFSALFDAVRATVTGDLLAVFGSVGADDRAKRPLMARIAEQACRWCYVTVEDPRGEDASIAVNDILQGFMTDHVTVIEDRGSAIRAAMAAARPGDAVLILGRGHETVMYYEGRDVALDDRQEARGALEELGFSCTPVAGSER